MNARFRWLLETMMRLQEINVEELDSSLDYWEAKAEIEARHGTKLVLKLDRLMECREEGLRAQAETFGIDEEI